MKKIDICGKEFEIDCNAFTYIAYRQKFKDHGIFEDFKKINDFTTMQVLLTAELKKKNPEISETEIIQAVSNSMLPYLDKYIEAITRIGYICCYTANQNIEEYEDWLKGLTRVNTNDMWIVEVTELAVNCFCGREGI